MSESLNAREVLIKVWQTETMQLDDAQKLRAIDELLKDCVNYFQGNGYEDTEYELYARAISLGYGDRK